MNYSKHYITLVERSRIRCIDGYFEKHHIIPRCLGGTDDPKNISYLTPEEHYVAHLLLVKIYPTERKLLYAARMMRGNPTGNRRSNKAYGWIKNRLSVLGHSEETKKKMSESHSGTNNHFYGKTHTEEVKKAHSIRMTGLLSGDKNPFFGKTHTHEVLKVLSEKCGREISKEEIARRNETRKKNRLEKLNATTRNS